MTFLRNLCNLLSRMFAADRCFGAARSSRWRKVRSAHLAAHPYCEACGRTDRLEVHHVVPFHVNPELELEPSNLMTLCDATCHFLIAHLRDWSSWNECVREDAQRLLTRIKNRPEQP